MPRSMRSSRPLAVAVTASGRCSSCPCRSAGGERKGRLAVEAGLPGERDVARLQLQVVEAVLAAIAGQAAAQLLEQWLAVVVRLPQAEAFDGHGQRQLQVGWQGSRYVARRLVDAQGRDVQGSRSAAGRAAGRLVTSRGGCPWRRICCAAPASAGWRCRAGRAGGRWPVRCAAGRRWPCRPGGRLSAGRARCQPASRPRPSHGAADDQGKVGETAHVRTEWPARNAAGSRASVRRRRGRRRSAQPAAPAGAEAVAEGEADILQRIDGIAGIDEGGNAPVLVQPVRHFGAGDGQVAAPTVALPFLDAQALVGVAAHRTGAAGAEQVILGMRWRSRPACSRSRRAGSACRVGRAGRNAGCGCTRTKFWSDSAAREPPPIWACSTVPRRGSSRLSTRRQVHIAFGTSARLVTGAAPSGSRSSFCQLSDSRCSTLPRCCTVCAPKA